MIPTPWTVGVRRSFVTKDVYGNEVAEYGAAEAVAVHSISGPAKESTVTDRDQDRIEHVILAPAGTSVELNDRIVVDGEEFWIDKILDWGKGPWVNPIAGVEIHTVRQAG